MFDSMTIQQSGDGVKKKKKKKKAKVTSADVEVNIYKLTFSLFLNEITNCFSGALLYLGNFI